MRQGRRGQKPLLILRAPEPVLCSHRWRAVVIDFCPSNPDPCPLSLSVHVCVCVRAAAPCLFPQMLSITLLCVCAFGYVSARSDSGNFLDDKWLTGRWDRFRDVSNMHVSSLLSHVYSSIPHFLPMPRCVFFFSSSSVFGHALLVFPSCPRATRHRLRCAVCYPSSWLLSVMSGHCKRLWADTHTHEHLLDARVALGLQQHWACLYRQVQSAAERPAGSEWSGFRPRAE